MELASIYVDDVLLPYHHALIFAAAYLLKSPDTHVKVRHVTTAPALVAVVVVRVVAGARVSDLHHHTATFADTIAIQVSTITILQGLASKQPPQEPA